jgi:thiamine pyrophosphate-dependent acetolactate synthase large subunit-like protein
MSGASRTTAEAILDLLERHGIDTIFSIPGIHTIEFYRSLPGRPIRHVTPRHEQGAAFMAYGYAFATGRPACCVLITGPGLTNAATGLAEAYSDSIPVVAIAANNLRAELGVGRGALHEIRDQGLVARQVAGFAHSVLDPANAVEALARGLALNEVGRPRPIVLDLPRDLIGAAVPPVPALPRLGRPAPDPEVLGEAAALLAGAERPIVVAGGGARQAAPRLRALAERLALPVVTTNAGKGILPERHPLALGSTLPFAPILERIAAADVVLAIGTELAETDLLYTGARLAIGDGLIRVDIDPVQLTMTHAPRLALLSDADLALQGFLAALNEGADADTRARREAEVTALRAALTGEWSAEAAHHKAVLDILAEAMGADGLVCADSTQLAYTGNHYYPSPAPGTWLFPNGFGTLGSALPAAFGARLGCPDRRIAAIVGDGSLLYTIEELIVGVEQRLGVPILLWNNRAYGEIRDAMRQDGIPTIGVDLASPDFCAIAHGFGCEALRLERLDALAPALEAAFARDRPTLIEIETDGPVFAQELPGR